MTLAIIAANCFAFFVFNVAGTAFMEKANSAIIAFGHVPSVANDIRTLPAENQIIPDYLYSLTAITSAFLHADLWHLGGNMLFIWVFGDNVEDAMGHIKFAIFYLACAFAAAWFHAFAFPNSDAPLIGASGAAAGIVAAYLMLHPKMKIWVLFLARIPVRLPAILVLGGWVLFQISMFIFNSGSEVSWAAHVGGIVAGVVLVAPLKRRVVPLFDRELRVPDAVELKPEEAIKWGR